MAIVMRTWKTTSGEIRTAWLVRYRASEGNYRKKTFKSKSNPVAWVAQIKTD